MTDVFAYAELDEILRGAGRTGAIGMSAIDGLIAALVAAPSFVHPEEWIPLIFGGRQPLHENSPELHAVKTIFNRYNEVSETLADWPPAYRPIFMVDDDGSIIARDSAVGFALGIGLRSKESNLISWSQSGPSGASSTSWVSCGGIHAGSGNRLLRRRMRLLEVVDLADMLAAWSSSKLISLQCWQVGKRRPLITVTSCGMSACAGSWVIISMPDCGTISHGLYSVW